MSEMTTPDQEPDQEEADSDNSQSQDTVAVDEESNPAVEKAPNPEGDPNDDRMGAPAMMPD